MLVLEVLMLAKTLKNWILGNTLFLEPQGVYLVNIQSIFEFRICIFNLIFVCLIDMIRRKTLRTRDIKTLVLDEADEMLNKGFKEQIYDIYRLLSPATQV